MLLSELKVVHGYEVPKTVSKEVVKLLKHLKFHGVLIYEHDDGHSSSHRAELEKIADSIGLITFSESYRLTVIDETAAKSFTIRGCSSRTISIVVS